jgi:hypothetical protein
MKKLHFYISLSRKHPLNRISFVFFLWILLFLRVPAFSQIREIRVDPSEAWQSIENFTASDAWSGNFVGKYWDEKQKGQIAEWLFSQQYDSSGNPEGIGLSMWRVNLGAGTLEQDYPDILPFQRRDCPYE